MSSISKLWRKLETKEYRDGYTQAQLSIEVPFPDSCAPQSTRLDPSPIS